MESKQLSKIEVENKVRILKANLETYKRQNLYHLFDMEIESLEKQITEKTEHIKSLEKQINDYIN